MNEGINFTNFVFGKEGFKLPTGISPVLLEKHGLAGMAVELSAQPLNEDQRAFFCDNLLVTKGSEVRVLSAKDFAKVIAGPKVVNPQMVKKTLEGAYIVRQGLAQGEGEDGVKTTLSYYVRGVSRYFLPHDLVMPGAALGMPSITTKWELRPGRYGLNFQPDADGYFRVRQLYPLVLSSGITPSHRSLFKEQITIGAFNQEQYPGWIWVTGMGAHVNNQGLIDALRITGVRRFVEDSTEERFLSRIEGLTFLLTESDLIIVGEEK